jgi:hypothetical protein
MAALLPKEVKACIHPRQRMRFVLALICAIILAPLLIFLTIATTVTLILPWFIFFVWISGEVFFAQFVGNSVFVSDTNYPRIRNLSEEIKTSLGVHKNIDIFIYEQGNFNAFMTKLFFRRAIFLNSEILETGVSDDEVRWIIGRFVGYWRAQKNAGIAGWMIRVARRFLILNFFILPYDRAMVYTGDRLALAVIGGDISSGISALQKLLVGRQLGYSVNPVGIVEQSRRIKGSMFAFLARVSTPFPHMIARYVDLIVFAQRVYPEQFRLFDAANPGLPANLKALGNEKASMSTLLRAFGIVVALLLLVGVTIGVAGGLVSLTMPALQSRFGPIFAQPDSLGGSGDSSSMTGDPSSQSADSGTERTLNLPDGAIYKGAVVADVPEGQGLLTNANGNTLEGTFHNGEIAEGTLNYTNGDSYVGSLAQGEPEGDGVLTFANGTVFTGTFQAGQPNGSGTFNFADGSEYTGEVRDGAADGRGTLTKADGTKLSGRWAAGELKKRK